MVVSGHVMISFLVIGDTTPFFDISGDFWPSYYISVMGLKSGFSGVKYGPTSTIVYR